MILHKLNKQKGQQEIQVAPAGAGGARKAMQSQDAWEAELRRCAVQTWYDRIFVTEYSTDPWPFKNGRRYR